MLEQQAWQGPAPLVLRRAAPLGRALPPVGLLVVLLVLAAPEELV